MIIAEYDNSTIIFVNFAVGLSLQVSPRMSDSIYRSSWNLSWKSIQWVQSRSVGLPVWHRLGDTIPYDTIYLRALKSWRYGQLSLKKLLQERKEFCDLRLGWY